MAFTLIELVVTLAIAVMIFIVILPQFGQFREKYTLNHTAEMIRKMVLEARIKAMAPTGTVAKNTYGVRFYKNISKATQGNYPLQLRALCTGCGATDTTVIPMRQEEFAQGIVISSFTPSDPSDRNDTWVNFKIGTGEFSCQDRSSQDEDFWKGASALTITLKDTRTNEQRIIKINRFTGEAWIEGSGS